MSKPGIIEIHGKEYKTVALRVNEFRESTIYKGWSIMTEIVKIDEEQCVIKTQIINADNRIVATGHAQEFRNASRINGTSYVEVCETSSIGRALAVLGLSGTEFASADEIVNAMHQQKNPPITQAATAEDIENVVKQINKAESIDELMGIYQKASTKYDKTSLAKLKTFLTDRKIELGE